VSVRLFIFIIALAFLSCKKTGLNYIKGIVTDGGTGEPINGAWVYLHKEHSNKHEIIEDSAVTNEKGEYKIDFSNKPRCEYRLSCKCKNYYEVYASMNTEIKHGRNAFNFQIGPYGYIILRLLKTTNQSRFFSGSITAKNYPNYRCYLFFPSSTGWSSSQALTQIFDTTFIFGIVGNHFNEITYSVFDENNSHNNFYKDTLLYIKKGDTLHYTVKLD
jgi:hypothetical protein